MAENSGMKNLVLTINKLQETFKRLSVHMDIDLPQIAVVGIQSCGKSSVLEKFIGRDFLPRGSGIVTRRPLILQLIYNENEYAKFDHSTQIFKDFTMIQKEIEDETERVVGKQKAVSNIPIVLKVFSPHVLNLTLIDLPGITKVPIGDQPSDIEHQIRAMILEYIEKETCLILAVTPANMDLANSEALKLAREVDSKGLRTIGVITKLDLMDQGTNAVEVLENRQFPLKRGYVGVVNRSQKDIDEKQDMKIAAEAELEFFENHPAYKHMASRMGTNYLQKILNKQLTDHILNTLPTLRDKLRKHQNELEEDFHHYESTSNIKLMNEIISQLKKEFRSELDGYGAMLTETKELTSGTQINEIYNESLRYENFNINFNQIYENDFRKEIAVTIRNTNGMYSNLFIPEKAFDRIVIAYIEKMKQPIEIYVDKISHILQNIIRKYTDKIVRFPNLREELKKLILSYIVEREMLCKQRLIEMIDCEMSYINKNHDDFKIFDDQDDEDEEDEKFSYKGFMQLSGGLVSSERYWFALSPDRLTWYKDDSERDMEGFAPLSSLKLSEYKGKAFKLTEVEGKILYKDSSSLKVSCKSPEEAKDWVEHLSMLGISYQKSSSSGKNDNSPEPSLLNVPAIIPTSPSGTIKKGIKSVKNIFKRDKQDPTEMTIKHSPRIDQQVDTIKNLVEKYIAIVIKNVKDRVPKVITWLVINNVTDFIDQQLVAHFYEENKVDFVMQKPPSEQERIDKVRSMYKACKEALAIIDEEYENINMKYT
ncbi:hypothetical protein PVAND_014535 [Polypedilum vanderplanki]|uniref:dynamin GTPase n=1 Tax=Polypedilum vanderplanki TaxID=319348 RepID=A0A9J6B9Y2_POLVA|nr:hypothetical protein PVAND_014535 [Polypedilum vanderplanki]